MRSPNDDYKIVVRVKIHGKPRLKIGAWLIWIGAKIARVHAKVWLEEVSPRMGNKKQ